MSIKIGDLTIPLGGDAEKLATPRTIALTGGATGSTTFDGSADANIDVTNINSQYVSLPANKLSALNYIEMLSFSQNAFNGLADENILVETADKGSDAWETVELVGRICDTNYSPTAQTTSFPKSKQLRLTFTVDQYRSARIFAFVSYFSSQGDQVSITKFEAALYGTDNFEVRDAIGGTILGWPSRFIVRCSSFVFGYSSSYYGKIRLTFECTETVTQYPTWQFRNIQALTWMIYNDAQKRIRMFENNADGIIVGGTVTADGFMGDIQPATSTNVGGILSSNSSISVDTSGNATVKKVEKLVMDYTLQANKWGLGVVPPTPGTENLQNIQINSYDYISSTSVQEIFPASNISSEQLKAYQEATIIGTDVYTTNSFQVKAMGKIPTIDIPITLVVWR